jgi:hypothetical protein
MEWRMTRQYLRTITQWELPVIDALSYRDVLDVSLYHQEREKIRHEALRRRGRR